jgi:O-antigen/teichoic acid export membrane protein
MSYNNVAVFGFHAAASRILGPDRYGALGALLAITLLFNVVTGAVGVAVIRAVAGHQADIGWSVKSPLATVTAVVVGVLAAGGALSPIIAHYLHLRSVVPVLMLALYCCAVLGGVVSRGVLLGQRQFRTVAVAVAMGATVRLTVGLGLASAFGITGALAGYALADALTTALMIVAQIRRASPQIDRPTLHVPLGSLALTVVAYGGMYSLSASDQFLARHLLTSLAAGLYVSASTAGSIALWLPYNVTSSVFPDLAGEAAGTSAARSFRRGLAAVSILTVGVSAFMMLVPHVTIAVMFGGQFRAAAVTLVLLAASNGAQGVTGFLLHHQLAHHRRTALIPWLALGAVAAGIYRFHHNADQVATVALVTSAGLLVVMLAASALLERSHVAGQR